MTYKCIKCNEIIGLNLSELLSGKYKTPKACSIKASDKGLCDNCLNKLIEDSTQ